MVPPSTVTVEDEPLEDTVPLFAENDTPMVPAVIAVTFTRAHVAATLVTETIPPDPVASLHAVEAISPANVHGPAAVGPESTCTRHPVVAVEVIGEKVSEKFVYPAT